MKLDWDLDGERLFEAGTDRGVVYPYDYENGVYGTGYAWNGLTGVDESPSGAEENAIYANNDKYANNRSKEEFAGTINAYTYPEEFELCDGTAMFDEEGMRVKQQKRKKFAFSYRTRVGNDIEGDDYGYKIHLFYNCMASPSSKSMETVNNDPNAVTFSWELSTTPIEIDGMKRSAHIIIDSRNAFPASIKMLEDMLYGTEDTEPKMPTVDELRDLYPQITLSGSLVHITDGAPDQPVANLRTMWEPTQDLNGYDRPWIGGTGKNLLENTLSGSTTSHGVTYTVNADGSVTATGTHDGSSDPSLLRIPISLPAGNYLFASGLDSSYSGAGIVQVLIWDTTGNNRAKKWDGTTTSDSAADGSLHEVKIIAEHTMHMHLYVLTNKTVNDVIFKPMICASTETDPTFAPYENVCPVTAASQTSAIRIGSNLLSKSPTAINGSVGPFTDGEYTFTVGSSGLAYTFYTLPIGLAGKTVYLSGILRRTGAHANNIAARITIINGDGVASYQHFPAYVDNEVVYSDAPITITNPVSGVRNIRLQLVAASTNDSSAGETMTVKDLQLCLNAGRPFTEYNRLTTAIQFGQDVYGGELDFITGVLTATYFGKVFDGTESWIEQSVGTDNRYFRYTVDDNTVATDHTDRRKCSHFPNASVLSDNTNEGYYAYTSSSVPNKILMNFRPPLAIASTAEEWKTYLAAQYAAGTPVTAVTYIENSVVIQLTPKQITTLLGDNSFWLSDEKGEFELTYRATDIHD